MQSFIKYYYNHSVSTIIQYNIMRKIHLLFLVALLSFISACKKDSTIGADLLPPEDLLNVRFTDTFTVNAKTLSDTFMRTDKLAKNYLGVINDSKFGFQRAGIVMELDKPGTVFDDTLGPFTLDSVVLLLRYTAVYGDTTVPQSFNVSTISNKINETQIYHSNTGAFPAASLIGSVSNYYIKPTNKVVTSSTDTTGVNGILRVKLNSYVGYSILNLGQKTLRDSALFKNSFPGIVIENATNTGKAMMEIDCGSIYSGIVIYYKDKYNATKEMRMLTNLIKISAGSLSSRQNGVNIFSNTLSSTVQNVINSGLPSDSVNYLLSQSGTTLKISLPTIENLGKVAVNRARILVTQVEQNAQIEFQPPSFMFLLKRNSSGLLDVLPTGDGVGLIDSTGVDDFGNKISRYSFDITKYVQKISKGEEANTDLYVGSYRSAGTDGTVNALNTITNGTVVNFGFSPSRIIFAGPNYSDLRYKMKLNLIYTLIK